jgi:hypothetical protein
MKLNSEFQNIVRKSGKNVRHNGGLWRISAASLGETVLASVFKVDEKGRLTQEEIDLTSRKKDALAIRNLIKMNLVS